MFWISGTEYLNMYLSLQPTAFLGLFLSSSFIYLLIHCVITPHSPNPQFLFPPDNRNIFNMLTCILLLLFYLHVSLNSPKWHYAQTHSVSCFFSIWYQVFKVCHVTMRFFGVLFLIATQYSVVPICHSVLAHSPRKRPSDLL